MTNGEKLFGVWRAGVPATDVYGWNQLSVAFMTGWETLAACLIHKAEGLPLGSFEFQFPWTSGARVIARVQAPDFDSALKMMGSAGKPVVVQEKS